MGEFNFKHQTALGSALIHRVCLLTVQTAMLERETNSDIGPGPLPHISSSILEPGEESWPTAMFSLMYASVFDRSDNFMRFLLWLSCDEALL